MGLCRRQSHLEAGGGGDDVIVEGDEKETTTQICAGSESSCKRLIRRLPRKLLDPAPCRQRTLFQKDVFVDVVAAEALVGRLLRSRLKMLEWRAHRTIAQRRTTLRWKWRLKVKIRHLAWEPGKRSSGLRDFLLSLAQTRLVVDHWQGLWSPLHFR
jgi:hypothetical protein